MPCILSYPGCFLKNYAICSLKNCTKHLPVILFTDELDKDYINGVKKIFQEIYQSSQKYPLVTYNSKAWLL